MRVIEMCPKCGHDLLDSVIAVVPAISRKECPHCGWSWEGKPAEVIRVPFNGMAPIHFDELGITVTDSESISSLLENFEYHPERRVDILKKYDSLVNG